MLSALLTAAPASAQQGEPSPLAVETVAGLDETVDSRGNDSTGVALDAVVSMGLGAGFEAIVRPSLQRFGNGEWNAQVWVATLRYERRGDVGVRVDAGIIPSPLGLGNLMLRPHLNPTIALPSSLLESLPSVELRGPRVRLLAPIYAYGAAATVSGGHWDARAAVMDTSPMRPRRVFADNSPANPPRFPTAVFGGGVTPIVGLRVGASLSHGGWLHAGAAPDVTRDLDVTLVTLETEYSVAYTKVMAEWVRNALETSREDEVASGWFVQGQQTITARWFAAGRVERMSTPVLSPTATIQQQHLTGVEETVGFRLTPEVTLRGSHRARRVFGRPGYDNTVAVSAVWWKRWM